MFSHTNEGEHPEEAAYHSSWQHIEETAHT